MPFGHAIIKWDGRDADKATLDVSLCKAVGERLHEEYPGYMFRVMCDSAQGILWITMPVLMGNWKYVFHLSNLQTDPNYSKIIQAAGEALERHDLPRSKIDHAAIRAAIEADPIGPRPSWDHKGSLIVPERLR